MATGELALLHAQIITPEVMIEDGTLLISAGRIQAVGPSSQVEVPAGFMPVELSDLRVLPGFIDSHTHGGVGHDFMAATAEEAGETLAWMARQGTTSALGTISTSPLEHTLDRLRELSPLVEGRAAGARLLGFHLEGPYINPEKSGAQPKDPIRPPDPLELEQLLAASNETVRMVTLAPELPGATEAIYWLAQRDVVVSLGHSIASYDQALAAIEAGARRATHVFNGSSPLHHRRPGLPGAALTEPSLAAEIIVDGYHLHPATAELIVRAKGVGGVILISDSNQAAGLGDGTYLRPGNRRIEVRDGAAWRDDGGLAGSTLTMRQALINMLDLVGVPLSEAARMATVNPAANLGVDGRKGRLAAGLDADLVIVDDEMVVEATFVEGNPVFCRPGSRLTAILGAKT